MGDDKNKRIDFVDLTKGVCIILVVMAHIGGAFEKLDYHSMIASFRMPLYFFISGISISINTRSQSTKERFSIKSRPLEAS